MEAEVEICWGLIKAWMKEGGFREVEGRSEAGSRSVEVWSCSKSMNGGGGGVRREGGICCEWWWGEQRRN